MNKKQILIVSENIEGSRLSDWLAQENAFEWTSTPTVEAAIELFHQHAFDLVILHHCSEAESRKMAALLPILQSETLLLHYNNETPEEMQVRVQAAFDQRKYERVSRLLVLDSSSQGAILNSMPPFSSN